MTEETKPERPKTRNWSGVVVDAGIFLMAVWSYYVAVTRGGWWELLFISAALLGIVGAACFVRDFTPAIRDSRGQPVKDDHDVR